mgnify:CR=1 FL=1
MGYKNKSSQEYQREYYLKNRYNILEQRRLYYENNYENVIVRQKQYQKQYYIKNIYGEPFIYTNDKTIEIIDKEIIIPILEN